MAVRQIVDIVGELVAKLEFTVQITGNVDNGGGNHVLSMDNTYYLTKAKGIKIGGNDYVVVSFEFNESITISPVGHTTPVTVDSFVLPAPLYFHGTINSTEREVLATMESVPDSYPIVYLQEHIIEDFEKRSSTLERKSPIRLFFVDIYNPLDSDLNPDLLEDVEKPLSNLDAEFLELLHKEKGIVSSILPGHKRTNLPRFAFVNRSGETEKIFNENATAVSFEITLPIRKCGNC